MEIILLRKMIIMEKRNQNNDPVLKVNIVDKLPDVGDAEHIYCVRRMERYKECDLVTFDLYVYESSEFILCDTMKDYTTGELIPIRKENIDDQSTAGTKPNPKQRKYGLCNCEYIKSIIF